MVTLFVRFCLILLLSFRSQLMYRGEDTLVFGMEKREVTVETSHICGDGQKLIPTIFVITVLTELPPLRKKHTNTWARVVSN